MIRRGFDRAVVNVIVALSTLLAVTSSAQNPDSDRTIKGVMAELVSPSADTLWGSVSLVETEAGLEEKGPQTEADWLALRHAAQSLSTASELMQHSGMKVALAGTLSNTPGIELEPDEIKSLIDADRPQWDRMSKQLGEVARIFLDAVDARNSKPLLDAGDQLNSACESCHQVYWYPSP